MAGHNGPVSPRPLLIATLACLALATGCGGDEAPATEATAESAPSAETSMGAPDVPLPDGVELTTPGTELGFGQTATVAYVANEQRSSALELEVVEARRGSIADLSGFRLDEATKATTPYYVDVRVDNVGEGTLGGTAVPLWANAGAGMLVQSSGFTADFETCPSTPLPRGFGPEATYEGCLVFLMPSGSPLTGLTYRGSDDQAPIVWLGDVETPTPSPSASPTQKKTTKESP